MRAYKYIERKYLDDLFSHGKIRIASQQSFWPRDDRDPHPLDSSADGFVKETKGSFAGESSMKGLISMEGNVTNCRIRNGYKNGIKVVDDITINMHAQDAYVFCMSTIATFDLMRKMAKDTCIEIVNAEELCRQIERQIGGTFRHGSVQYNDLGNYDSFRRPVDEKWMHEYRICGQESTNSLSPSARLICVDPRLFEFKLLS